jgi:hypothetical protein
MIAFDSIRKRFVFGLSSGTWAFTEADKWVRLSEELPESFHDPRSLMIFDPDVGNVLWMPLASSSETMYRFDDDTGKWEPHGTFPYYQGLAFSDVYAAHDSTRGRHLISDEDDGFWWYDGPARLWTRIADAPAEIIGAHSLAYDSRREIFVVLKGRSDGSFVAYTLDAEGRWAPLSLAGTAPDALGLGGGLRGGFWNTLNYDARRDAFLFVNVRSGNGDPGSGGQNEGDVETWAFRLGDPD